jgi:hypothetical protein
VGRLVRTALLSSLVLGPAAALAASPPSQVWVVNCNTEQYKPKSITIACGDGGIYLAKLQWSAWSKTSAAGAGSYDMIDCTPSCVQGHLRTYPVKVTLSKPRSCPGRKHKAFRHIGLVFTSTQPTGAATQITLPCPA